MKLNGLSVRGMIANLVGNIRYFRKSIVIPAQCHQCD